MKDSAKIVHGSKLYQTFSALLKKKKYSTIFISCDSNTIQHCLPAFIRQLPVLNNARLIELEPGESNKDIEVIKGIWQTFTEHQADKHSLLINLGGGTVCDTGSFAAATFKRGIEFINVPTTLLAMADASVGGKNGINFSGIKNLVGTIQQPEAVFIDPTFLNTLPFRHILNGYAEILKMALISDKRFFQGLLHLKITEPFDAQKIILRSVKLKSAIVKKDPYEKGFRKILNFGHSTAHALESLCIEAGKDLLHGEAVAIGMAIEAYLGFLYKLVSKAELSDILNCLSLNFSLPIIEDKDFDSFFTFLKQDKKNRDKTFYFSLLKGIGHCHPGFKVTELQVGKALQYYNDNIANAPAL